MMGYDFSTGTFTSLLMTKVLTFLCGIPKLVWMQLRAAAWPSGAMEEPKASSNCGASKEAITVRASR